MATHTYVFQKITYPANLQNPGADAKVTVIGTVDGLAVTATCWWSEYQKNSASVIAAQTFLANQMLLQVPPQETVPQNAPPPGTTITI